MADVNIITGETVGLGVIDAINSWGIIEYDDVPLWGGGARIEPSTKVVPGSYRMGSRNPDETRGGSW